MGTIDTGRWLIGGVVAAVILFIVDFVLNGVVLRDQWAAAMAALQQPEMEEDVVHIAIFAFLNLLVGLTAIWIYAGIRPRFGPGVKTAVCAGIAVWILAGLVPYAFFLVIGIFPPGLLLTIIAVGLVQCVVATVAGAWVYREG